MESSASFDSERILQGPAQNKPKGKRKGTDAGSNHAVAKDNGDEGTSGGSDHGDDGPGADNANETNAESKPAPERTTAALAQEWPEMHDRFRDSEWPRSRTKKISKQPKQTTQST